jgi:transposase
MKRSSASKKSVAAGERDRPDVARRRLQWTKYQDRVEAERLVLIGRQGRSWSPSGRGEPWREVCARAAPIPARAPYRSWSRSLRHDQIDAPWFIEVPIDGVSFRTYVEKVLLQTLGPGDIVVLDGSHKNKAVRQLIRSVGAKLFFLPTYSPDLNPIEQVFAKLKHLPRKAAARTVDAICAATGHALDAFSPKNAQTNSKIQAIELNAITL